MNQVVIKKTQLDQLSLVQSYFNCFNQKNYAGMVKLVSSEIVHEVNQGQAQVGVEKFTRFLAHMEDCYDETLENLTYLSSDSAPVVAVEFFVKGTYLKTDGSLPKAHGQTYRIRAGSFLEVQNGKISRITTYYNLPGWIAAVSS